MVVLSTNTDARQILAIHQEIQAAGQTVLERSRDVGRLLARQKANIPHGKWGQWCAENVPEIAPRTIVAYMAVSDRWETLEGWMGEQEDVSLRGALNYLAEVRREEAGVPPLDEIIDTWAQVATVFKKGGRFLVELYEDCLSTRYSYPKAVRSQKALWALWKNDGETLVREYRTVVASRRQQTAETTMPRAVVGDSEWAEEDPEAPLEISNSVADLRLVPEPESATTRQGRMHERLTGGASQAATVDSEADPDENYTPEWVWRPLLEQWGRSEFDLDVASSDRAELPAKAKFTKDNSALEQPWAVGGAETLGWDNCPYSMNEQFSRKFLEELEAGNLPDHFFVLNKQDSRTAWHQRYLRHADAVCRITRYVKFRNPTVPGQQGATFSLELFYFGRDRDKFAQATAHLGVVMYPAAIADGLASGHIVATVVDGSGVCIKPGDSLVYKAGGFAGVVTGFTPEGRCILDRHGHQIYTDGAVCLIDSID